LIVLYINNLDFEISKDALFIISVSEDKSILLWKIEDIYYKNITLVKKLMNLKEMFLTCTINFKQDLIATV